MSFAVMAASCFPFLSLGATEISLERGAELPGGPRYWAVEDTVLDSANPDGNFGGASYLTCGPGRVLLIRFGDLRRALGPNKRITKASILFTVTGGDPAPLARAGEMLVPWGEGPAQVVGYGAGTPTLTAPAWSASWRHRRAGEGAISWQQPGASGVGDARAIGEAKSSSPDNDHVRIEGLAATLQRQYDRPFANFGLSLAFQGNVEFASSQSKSGRPVLELEVEPVSAPSGPDLAVVRIVRTPDYPRYSPSAEVSKAVQDGVEVPISGPPANLKEKHQPEAGEEVTYTAIIKNLGDSPATGFTARWSQRERVGGAVEYDRTVGPGQETAILYKAPFRASAADHRLNPIGLVIDPKGPDSEPSNNGLTIQEGALAVGFRFAPNLAEVVRQTHPFGARNLDELAQALVELWNETILPQSRFSFAPDGALERLRVQKVEVAEVGSAEFSVFDDLNMDVTIAISADARLNEQKPRAALLQLIGRQLGLPDLSAMNVSPVGNPDRVRLGGQRLERYAGDLFPGLMGGGDTRFEGFVPALLIPPYEPTLSPVFDALPMEPTDLLSASDVAALNAAVGMRRGFEPAGLFGLPASIILKVTDSAGLIMRNATVEVFPMAGGVIDRSEPTAKMQTSDIGTAVLPNRPTQLPEGFKPLVGKAPGPNPFGRIDPHGQNGVLLLRISAGGNVGYAYVKAWQVVDAYRRNPSPVLVFDLRVNTGAEVDASQNLAKNRIVADSAGSTPAKLAPLVDEVHSAEVELPGGKDAWVEIDLGRDRAFGEVRLSGRGAFWEKFSVSAFATGQTIAEAKLLAREASWSWTYANRSDAESEAGARTVGYRSLGLRARYIRITCLAEGPPGRLTEIKVLPLKSP